MTSMPAPSTVQMSDHIGFRRVPDFFLVGAAKSGTSSLYMYLSQHPRIFFPAMKEPHFFSDFHHPALAHIDSLEKYLDLFRDCPPDAMAGDASTSYLYSPNAPARIREVQPGARILAILRNPIDRAYSFYWHNRRGFHEPLGFEEALEAESQRATEKSGFAFHYVESGRYHDQVARYMATFGRKRVRVYLLEDLKRDSGALCNDVFGFLGLEPHPVHTETVYNRSGPVKSRLVGRLLLLKFPGRRTLGKLSPALARHVRWRLIQGNMGEVPPMRPATRQRLADLFREDILKLQGLIDRDLSSWLAP